MKKKLTISLIAVFLILGVIFAIGALASESEDNPRDMINKFEAAVKEVLGDDYKKQTETVVAGTIKYGDKEGNEIHLLDIIHCEDESIFNLLFYSSNIKKLYEELAKLTDEKEKRVLTLRYGLYGGEELPQREVGKMMGISRSYVSRIEKRALENLRKKFIQ